MGRQHLSDLERNKQAQLCRRVSTATAAIGTNNEVTPSKVEENCQLKPLQILQTQTKYNYCNLEHKTAKLLDLLDKQAVQLVH